MLAKMVDSGNDIGWQKVLEPIEYAMNNTLHKAVNEHPSVMLFGVRQKGKILDTLKENVLDLLQVSKARSVQEVRQQAEIVQQKAQKYNKEYTDSKRLLARKFNLGDYVAITNASSQVGASSKLIPKFRGPYKVAKILEHDRYLVEDVEGFQQTQVPYKGTWSITNLKPWLECKTKRNMLGRNNY